MPDFNWDPWIERVEERDRNYWFEDVYTDYDIGKVNQVRKLIRRVMESEGYEQDWGKEMSAEVLEEMFEPEIPPRSLVEPDASNTAQEYDKSDIPREYWGFYMDFEPFGFSTDSQIDFLVRLPAFEQGTLFEAGFMIPEAWYESQKEYVEFKMDSFDPENELYALKMTLDSLREHKSESGSSEELSSVEIAHAGRLRKLDELEVEELKQYIREVEENPEKLREDRRKFLENHPGFRPSQKQLNTWNQSLRNLWSEYENDLDFTWINIPETEQNNHILEMSVPEDTGKAAISQELRTATDLARDIEMATPWSEKVP